MTAANNGDLGQQENELIELRNQVAQLERQNAAMVNFLSTAAHDLRTPLNATLGFARLLSDKDTGDLSPVQSRFVENIITSNTHLMLLINDLVDLSILQSGSAVLEPVEVDLGDCLTYTHDLIAKAAQEKNIKIVMQGDQHHLTLQADDRRIRQLVFNLVANAVKAAPEGGSVELTVTSEQGAIRLSATDNGDAIPADKLLKAFEPFGLGPPQVDALVPSTGLGIAISSLIAKIHGGDIAVESTEGVGSTFTVTIPS